MSIVRRVLVAVIAGVGVILLGWNAIDGTIHYRRGEFARSADPGMFWFTAGVMLLAFGAALYWAVWGAARDDDDPAP